MGEPCQRTAVPLHRRQATDRREGQDGVHRVRLLRLRRHLSALAGGRLRLLRTPRARVSTARSPATRRASPPRREALPPHPKLGVRDPLPPPGLGISLWSVEGYLRCHPERSPAESK